MYSGTPCMVHGGTVEVHAQHNVMHGACVGLVLDGVPAVPSLLNVHIMHVTC